MIRHLWQEHRLLSLAFLLALALMLFFGTRAVIFSLRFDPEAIREQPLAGWMTPGLVGHAYHLPPEVLGPLLGLDPDGERRRITLEEIAAQQGVPLDRFLAELQARIDALGPRP